MTLRLVKSTTELEGRFFESWALVDADDELAPWPANEALTVVGTPARRLDGIMRVTGAARYTVDISLPGMLHAAVLRSPLAHARVTGLDLAAARRVPGVRTVLGPDAGLAGPHGDIGRAPDAPVLTDQPEYAGQPIAAVAADTPEAAAAGLEALGLKLEALPFVVDLDDALREQRFTDEPAETGQGDAATALAGADIRVEMSVATPAHLQVPMEPHAAVADWRADGLTVWLSTQGMFAARDELARGFGLPRESVRVIAEYVGGGFGGKASTGTEPILAAELSRRAGRPVKLVNDRHAEQLDGGRRAATRQSLRLGAASDGTLLAVDADALIGVGLGGLMMSFFAARVLYPTRALYTCANTSAQVFPLRINLRCQNAFRAPGVMEGITVFEQAIDELAIATGLDPLALRRHLHADVDQISGQPYSNKRLRECYDRAEALSGWADRDRLRERQPDGLLRGMGCATQTWWGGGGPPAQAIVRIDSDGTAVVVTGIQDTGTGTTAGARLVAAQQLGLRPEQVTVLSGDTRHGTYSPMAAGSMITGSVMPAVRSAAGKARTLLLQVASDVLEISADDLVLTDGRISSRDGAIDVPVAEVTANLGQSLIEAKGSRGPNPDGIQIQTFGCQIAQVAVDPGVGEVVVEHVWAVHDVGRIVNPLTASSQVEGGVLQGVGFALSEELVVDPTTGVPVNATFDDYKVPTIADVPAITVEFVDVPDDNVPNVGAKGLGEPPIIPTAAAIANAFAHATGRRASALPLTRARVFEALR